MEKKEIVEKDMVVEEKKEVKKKKLSKKGILITVLVVLLCLFPLACFGFMMLFVEKPEEKTKPKNDTKEVEVVEEPVEKEVPKIKIVDESSTSRPFAVMINNHRDARPLQSGLQDAYIIYEMIVEGGITRYMALFLDQNTERIGSIRSARHYYLDYALENDAIYVHHGNSPQALSDFSKLGIDRIEVSESRTGWRAKGLGVAYEHTLFTNIEMLGKGIGNKRTVRNKDLLLKYSVNPLDLSSYENSVVANSVSIPYSNYFVSSYEYDPEAKVYKRFVNGVEHKDYVTGQQYTFKNIITYQVRNYTIAGDNKGRQTLENIGSGTGYYISNGYAVPINWSKASRGAQTKYTLQDGTELVVNDGNTFIQIQPKNQTLSIS